MLSEIKGRALPTSNQVGREIDVAARRYSERRRLALLIARAVGGPISLPREAGPFGAIKGFPPDKDRSLDASSANRRFGWGRRPG